MLGTLLGIGISVCVAIILFYCTQWATSLLPKAARWVLALHVAGQMNQILIYLEQIGWLSSNKPLWNTHWFISERSEIGHFMTAFIGYRESPSLLYIGMYVIWVLIPMLWMHFRSTPFSKISTQLNRSTSS